MTPAVPQSWSDRVAASPILVVGTGRFRHWVVWLGVMWLAVVVMDVAHMAQAGVTVLRILGVATAVVNALFWCYVMAKRRSAGR